MRKAMFVPPGIWLYEGDPPVDGQLLCDCSLPADWMDRVTTEQQSFSSLGERRPYKAGVQGSIP